ncbi:MAG: hypothetical protein IJM30_05010 [Thermoguttaceae bacterium]|nr:hypothetical protein [Thermoguttaceae bacterium]
MIGNCRHSAASSYDCGCRVPKPFRECSLAKRLALPTETPDGAALNSKIVDGVLVVDADYCNEQHCRDFEPMPKCVYATETSQKWVGDSAKCVVVECRNPEAKGKLKTFKDERGREVLGVRRPCDENFNLLPNADYLHVRSRFCGRDYCPFYCEERKEENESDSKNE